MRLGATELRVEHFKTRSERQAYVITLTGGEAVHD